MKNDRTLRIINIMQDKNMNATQFSEAIGIQRAAMSHIMLGRNNPSADVITRIIERFDDIDPGWLLTGKGQMKKIIPDHHPASGINSGMKEISGTKEQSGNENTRKTNPVLPANKELGLFDQQPVSSGPQSNHNGVTGHVAKSRPETSPVEDYFPAERRVPAEDRKGADVNQTDNSVKIIEKEVIVYKERPTRTIDKLLIFYSDNTYETFIPEKRDAK
ncbi:MAG: helix-turn-helix domain-containing protein [Tannerella sp.]|jgi:transcriptional regulator with XRE-family HTH domain|nr:helix-turn-helix domain-containing protein [Tannerella sp.]